MAEGDKGEGHFALGIDVQQTIDAGVHEAAHHFGWQTEGGGDGEQVGEESAIVPPEMTVRAGLILPGIAPISAGANDDQRGVGDGGLAAGRFEQDAAIISGAQPPQAELGGGKVIDAGFEVGEAAANQVELDLVERAGAGSRAKVDLAAGMFPFAGDSRGEIE